MAAEAARQRATYQDVLDAPEHLVAELLAGELHTHPRPAGPHSEAASVLGMDIGGAFHRGRGGPGGWIILDEPELHLGADVLVPDLAGWRRERLPAVPNAAYIELAPDWACEVLSKSTALIDRQRKTPIYAREGVAHLWLVDPRSRTVEVCGLRGHPLDVVLFPGSSSDDAPRGAHFRAGRSSSPGLADRASGRGHRRLWRPFGPGASTARERGEPRRRGSVPSSAGDRGSSSASPRRR